VPLKLLSREEYNPTGHWGIEARGFAIGKTVLMDP